jgi:hypothetical protein
VRNCFARNGSPFGRGYVRYDWLTAETLRPRLFSRCDYLLAASPPYSQKIVLFHRQTMIIMEHPEGGGDDASQKRKRRPKSYQGCTQCRLARRKCGEGMITYCIYFRPDLPCRQGDNVMLLFTRQFYLLILTLWCRTTSLCVLCQRWETV